MGVIYNFYTTCRLTISRKNLVMGASLTAFYWLACQPEQQKILISCKIYWRGSLPAQLRKTLNGRRQERSVNQRFGRSMVSGILALNGLIYLLWQIPSERWLAWMMRNFLVSGEGVLAGYLWTLITAEF